MKDTVMNQYSFHWNQKRVNANLVKIQGGPLKWWAEKQSTFPTVTKLDRKYIAVETPSAAPECLYSVGENMLTKKRNRLSRDMAAEVICLRDTLKNKLW